MGSGRGPVNYTLSHACYQRDHHACKGIAACKGIFGQTLKCGCDCHAHAEWRNTTMIHIRQRYDRNKTMCGAPPQIDDAAAWEADSALWRARNPPVCLECALTHGGWGEPPRTPPPMKNEPPYLFNALKAVGYDMPKECVNAELRMPVDAPFQITFICNITTDDMERIGRALQQCAADDMLRKYGMRSRVVSRAEAVRMTEAANTGVCAWAETNNGERRGVESVYVTDCGINTVFPLRGIRYCPYCGKAAKKKA
jgi:hypothetical protein